MRVYRCTKCEKRGGYLVFRSTKKNNYKYPYVGHYDPSKKSKRTWCSLNKTQLNQIEFNEDWYANYIKLIRKIQRKYRELGEDQIVARHTLQSAKLLEKKGFLTYRIADRVYYDVSHIPISEKEIQDILDERRH